MTEDPEFPILLKNARDVCHDVNSSNHVIMLNAQLLQELWFEFQPQVESVFKQNGLISVQGGTEEVPQILEAIIQSSRNIAVQMKNQRQKIQEIVGETAFDE